MAGIDVDHVGLGVGEEAAVHRQVSPTETACGLPLVVLGEQATYGAHLVRSRWVGPLPDGLRLCACARLEG